LASGARPFFTIRILLEVVMQAPPAPRPATSRDLLYFATPALWPTWPFLAVIRRHADGEEDYGVLYDCWSAARRPGYSATVFLTNFFLMPRIEEEFFALSKEIFDTVDEMANAGWRVD
jgi:hypothetical protein